MSDIFQSCLYHFLTGDIFAINIKIGACATFYIIIISFSKI
jgi:hypothetical protein